MIAASSSKVAPPRLQSRRFIGLYALAAAGGSASYSPFLTLLLPVRVAEIWEDRAVEILSYTAFAGAAAASLANIAFGWASDRTRNRRGWIVAGAATSGALLVAVKEVDTLSALLAMIVAWQIALNMMLAPLSAWAGDCIPDEQKGTLGGLLSAAPAIGALTGAFVTLPGLAGADMRLALVAGLAAIMVLPVVFFGKPRPMPHLMKPAAVPIGEERARIAPKISMPVRRMWLARLLMQISEAALFAFLLFWFQDINAGMTDNDTAAIFTAVLFVSIPLAVLVGRWSDRAGRPILPLTVTSACGAMGLLVMAGAQDLGLGIAGYVLFGTTAAIFLALHSGQTLRVLPRPATRGRDLGFFNLTNTVPSLIMPWLTLALVPLFGFDALFLLLSCLAALASILLGTMRRL